MQGERAMASDNKSLGRFKLPGIAPSRRGVPQIEVTFDIDANGIVSVSAKDLGTGKSQQVTITGGTALAQDEIDRMVGNAEEYANEDKERRELAEARNQADHTAYQTENMLEEHGDKLTDDERAPITDKIAELRKLLEDQASAEDLNRVREEVMKTSQILGQKIYEASAAENATEGEEAPVDGDDVVEAEIVDEGEEA